MYSSLRGTDGSSQPSGDSDQRTVTWIGRAGDKRIVTAEQAECDVPLVTAGDFPFVLGPGTVGNGPRIEWLLSRRSALQDSRATEELL